MCERGPIKQMAFAPWCGILGVSSVAELFAKEADALSLKISGCSTAKSLSKNNRDFSKGPCRSYVRSVLVLLAAHL